MATFWLGLGIINMKILKDIGYNTLSSHASDIIWPLLYFENYLTMNEDENLCIKNMEDFTKYSKYGLSGINNYRVQKNNAMMNMKYVDESSDEEIKYGNKDKTERELWKKSEEALAQIEKHACMLSRALHKDSDQ
ncbi:16879_t:CDS:2 [Gigaspora margarita]|uniref:16879_t:CDS:1 n=1 Tax=Gigaspora margarita TaxID=4874 RepID=A0ABN7UQW8_GIGMA|nr:16879_t:CDS:2 [Gigaspora margarita]